jgi:hypothetical protein
MTVKELKKILKDIPGDFDIAMDMGDESLMPICPTDSHIAQLEFNDSKKKIFVFILCPCSCIPHEDETTLN